ncbi:hypothetical protein AB0L40_02995 [Patulibacter sp. NPDC049589]|uniref:hypothetical protein n=1 Tax=Patulibacter sp. NPDC049589 TaxID=3154731 RepID=UPI00341EAD17
MNDLGTVVDFVRNGLAVAITARGTATDPRIALVPIRGDAPRFMIRLVSPASGPGGAVARAFVAVAERVAGEAA